MAHPTINIIEEPSLVCPNAAYNCVKFGFECTDFKTTAATFASFTIDCSALSVVSIAPGGTIQIAGNIFTTDVVNTFELFDTQAVLTPASLTSNLFQAINLNNDLFTKYDIVQTSPTLITATARVSGVIDNSPFDVSAFFGTGVVMLNTPGINAVYRENYRLIVELWEVINTAPLAPVNLVVTNKISSESYIPNENGEFYINLGNKIAPLLSSKLWMPPFFGINPASDLAKTFVVRYGESYSDGVSACETSPKNFATSNQFIVINSAFERQKAADYSLKLCDGGFMTNAPDYTELCEDSICYLWANLYNIVPFQNPFPVIRHEPFMEIFYTDGTSSIHTYGAFGTGVFPYYQENSEKIYAIEGGGRIMSFLADPSKTVSHWRVRVVVRDTALPIPTGDTYYLSQYFKLISCCEPRPEFYFLNPYGGYDTITFTQVLNAEIESEYAIFERFTSCESENTWTSGREKVNQSAFEVFEANSFFVNNYQNREWLKEFLASPIKYVRQSIEGVEIITKIIVFDTSVLYYSKDDNNIIIKLRYAFNEDINIQKN